MTEDIFKSSHDFLSEFRQIMANNIHLMRYNMYRWSV